jgi:hypothetical protein
MKFIATVAELEAAKSETAKAIEALGLMEVRATTAEKSLTEATASVGALTAERDALKVALEDQGSQAVAAKAALIAKEGELATLKAGAGNVAAVAAATVAAMGHEPVKVSVSSVETDKVLPRAQFNNLKPVAQMTFIKGGGKLTDN